MTKVQALLVLSVHCSHTTACFPFTLLRFWQKPIYLVNEMIISLSRLLKKTVSTWVIAMYVLSLLTISCPRLSKLVHMKMHSFNYAVCHFSDCMWWCGATGYLQRIFVYSNLIKLYTQPSDPTFHQNQTHSHIYMHIVLHHFMLYFCLLKKL